MKFNVSYQIREVVRELLPGGDTSASSVSARLREKFPSNKKIRDAIENKAYFSVSISTAKKKVLAELSATGPSKPDLPMPTNIGNGKTWCLKDVAELSKLFIIESTGLSCYVKPRNFTDFSRIAAQWVDMVELIGEENARSVVQMIG